MPSLDSCISDLYEPGNIPGSSGLPPTTPVLTSTSFVTLAGAGSLRCNAVHNRAGAAMLAGTGGLRCDATNANSDPFFANVVLLVGPASTTDTGTTFTDESLAAHGSATVNGNAQVDTGTVKFVSSMQFDGSGDWIEFADSADWTLSSANSDKFTIDCWIRWDALGSNPLYLSQLPSAGTPVAWFMNVVSPTELRFAGSSDGSSFDMLIDSSTASLAINTWYHIACDKDATGKIRVYKNGAMVASGTPANSSISNIPSPLAIGARTGGGTPTQGHMEDLRITKGVARYASDSGFTPPTARYPRS